MAIVVYTRSPRTLLDAIYKAIDDQRIVTWSYDKDGDFTHTRDQWREKAWLHPQTSSGLLQLGLIGQRHVVMTKSVYGVYHGRFVEALLTHFDSSISSITATAQQDAVVDHFK